MRLRLSDIAVLSGFGALVVFCILTQVPASASGTPFGGLIFQGTGSLYSVPVNDRATLLEYACRDRLYELGSAQAGYAMYISNGSYAYLDDLIVEGYLQPNVSGRSLCSGYSISFFLPPAKRGFTLVAEPTDFDLRAFMITENLRIVTLTPSVDDDPNRDWTDVRELESDRLYAYGSYRFLSTEELISFDTPLQIRLNREVTNYALVSYHEDEQGNWVPDDSLVYFSGMSAYLRGRSDE